jgi:poly(beta-D-mannuronate) C5 epimerase
MYSHVTASLNRNSFASAVASLLFLMIDPVQHTQEHLSFFKAAEAGEVTCIQYDETENTIAVNCSASFLDLVQAINDPDVIELVGNGEYILKANLEVADGVSFEMNSSNAGRSGNLEYLKIAGAYGIIVYGKILMDGIRITSWDIEDNSPIFQTETGSIPRAFINFRGSEGGLVQDSEISHLGYTGSGVRGFDLYGDGPSHDLVVRGSEFHHMWFAFFSNGAYNIVVDGNEYHNNIKYALDPHTGTYNMNITSNWLHHNPIGVICSLDCYDIIIEGNIVEHNRDYGIFFSRNMTDSVARNNDIYNTTTGVMVSESPYNQIHNNKIERATSQGIRLQNPQIPDDGSTVGNWVYNNTVINSGEGVGAARSHNNTLENNEFSNITSAEYMVSGNSGIIIREQFFDNALIAEEGSATESLVEIVDSGTIQVIEGAGSDDNDDESEEFEVILHNTDNQPYRMTVSNGDSIAVKSAQPPATDVT